MKYIHSKDIVHRDLKLCNVVLDMNDNIKVIDFGLSKKIIDCTSTFVGTPVYMSP